MKAGIHPVYKPTRIVCACGNKIETRSTHDKDELHVEICAACHPFFTGKQKLMDKAGRVERFRKRYEKTEKPEKADKTAKTAKSEKAEKATASS